MKSMFSKQQRSGFKEADSGKPGGFQRLWDDCRSAEVTPPKEEVPILLGHGRICHALSQFCGELRLVPDERASFCVLCGRCLFFRTKNFIYFKERSPL